LVSYPRQYEVLVGQPKSDLPTRGAG
jgi:hypothetical protein